MYGKLESGTRAIVNVGAWRSLVAHLLWEQGVASSNLAAPTILTIGASGPSRTVTAMAARIFRPAKTAMQSGQAKTQNWVLEFEPEARREVEPLMGWTSSRDMKSQIRMTFSTRDGAIAYAKKHGIAFQVIEPHPRKQRRRSYGDNFSFGRVGTWTH